MRVALNEAKAERSDNIRTGNNSGRYPSIPWDLVPSGNARMETTGNAVADTSQNDTEADERFVYNGNNEVQGTDSSMGTQGSETE